MNVAAEGCAESRLLLSRRSMLGVTAGLFSWAFAPKFASAATADPRLLVVVLRGGMDGLSVVPPYGARNYVTARGNLFIPESQIIKLSNSSDFGFHPDMRTFASLYEAGDVSVVHATGVPLWSRSHFDCQDNLENGLPGLASNSTGWLNRLLQAMPSGDPIRSGGAIEIGQTPLILRGREPVLGWTASTTPHVEDPIRYLIRSLYKQRDKELWQNLELGLKSQSFAEGLGSNLDEVNEFHKGMLGAGRLLAAPAGPRIAVLSVSGWDTHTRQADELSSTSTRTGLLRLLDDGLAKFKTTVGSAWSDTVVMFVTEFGRMVAHNGNLGSDHGVGTITLLAGGAVKGRQVVTKNWPGLMPDELYEGRDLYPTIDLRSVFKGVLMEHLDVPTAVINRDVFPDSAKAKPLRGLVKSA